MGVAGNKFTPPGSDKSFEAMLLVGNCAFWSFLLVVMVRVPFSGLVWLMGPVLCTVAAFGEPDRDSRARAQCLNLIVMGILQFIFAALRAYPLLIVLAVPLAVLLTSYRSSGNNAGAAICASLQDMSNTDVGSAAETLMLTLTLALLVTPSGWLLDHIFFGKNQWNGIKANPPLTADAISRRMAAFGLAFCLMYSLNWQYGYWIPFTVSLGYSNGATSFGTRRVVLGRTFGAPFGFAAAILWLGTVCYINYQFTYLGAIFLLLAFYYSFKSNDYIGFSIMFIMICGTFDNLIYGSSPQYGNGWQLFFQAAVSTIIGAGTIELVESGAIGDDLLKLRGNPPRSAAGYFAPDES